jgi:hypothetical protein
VTLLDNMLPTLSKLQNTKIVVAGYTDNVPIGAKFKAKGYRTTSTCLRTLLPGLGPKSQANGTEVTDFYV